MIFLKLCYTTSVGHRQSSLLILLALGKRRDGGEKQSKAHPSFLPSSPSLSSATSQIYQTTGSNDRILFLSFVSIPRTLQEEKAIHFQHIKNLRLPFSINEKEGRKDCLGRESRNRSKCTTPACSKASYVHEQNVKQLKIHRKLNHLVKLLM